MKGGYEIVTIGSKGAITFGSGITLPGEEDKRIIESIDCGKPVLIYPNFTAGGHKYTSPFFATLTRPTGDGRLVEIRVGDGYLVKFATKNTWSYVTDSPAATTELDMEDPYAMPAMEV